MGKYCLVIGLNQLKNTTDEKTLNMPLEGNWRGVVVSSLDYVIDHTDDLVKAAIDQRERMRNLSSVDTTKEETEK